MPLYTFKCQKCKKEDQAFFKIKDEKKVTCSNCGIEMDREIKGTGFSISGPGVFKEGFSGYTTKQPENIGKRYRGD